MCTIPVNLEQHGGVLPAAGAAAAPEVERGAGGGRSTLNIKLIGHHKENRSGSTDKDKDEVREEEDTDLPQGTR